MTSPHQAPALEFHSDSEEETRKLGADVAMALLPGDMLGLTGDLGVGKSVFCRSIIQHLAGNPELEVASPTYTLCNSYDTTPPIAHFDLYRVGEVEEVNELGIDEALEVGCALVEWPENGFETRPVTAIQVSITEDGDFKRIFRFSGANEFIATVLLVPWKFADFLKNPVWSKHLARHFQPMLPRAAMS